MIRADQIPDEVVEAAMDAWGRPGTMKDVIAAVLNAWPEMECRPTFGPSRIILPLPQGAAAPQEVSDE